ncbi:unnamed protein product, partial [marine sediment metagenome]
IDNVTMLLSDERAYADMANAANPYGDGRATERILDASARFLNGGEESP